MVNLILESTSQIGLDDIKKFLAENFKLEENLQIFELKKQEDKSSIGIQELKDFLNEFINLSFKKLAIIYTAEIMTLEAQNFLLKPLEDMSSSINFVLATSSEHSLLPTVKSRCITLRYNGNSVAQKNTSTFIFQNLIEENENEFFILLDKLLKECKKKFFIP